MRRSPERCYGCGRKLGPRDIYKCYPCLEQTKQRAAKRRRERQMKEKETTHNATH